LNYNILIISIENNKFLQYNLKDGMPLNPIIDVSVELYDEELDIEL